MQLMTRRSAGVFGILVATVVAVAGCGDDDSAEPTSPGEATTGVLPGDLTPEVSEPPMADEPAVTETTEPDGAETTVTATLTEFQIELSETSLTAGTYTFDVVQAGQMPHALTIEGPGGVSATSETLQPDGGSDQLTVTLEPGTYQLWCPIGSHRAQGMELTLEVT